MRICAFLIAALLMTTPAWAADVDGQWTGSISTPNGDVAITHEFKADGTMLAEVLGLAFQAFGTAANATATLPLYRLDWAVADGPQELVLERFHSLVDEVFLGREVVEHRRLGHLRRPGDLGHAHVLETAPGEQLQGSGRDELAGLVLLALPQPEFLIHSLRLPKEC